MIDGFDCRLVRVGDRVEHEIFGVGIIQEIEKDGHRWGDVALVYFPTEPEEISPVPIILSEAAFVHVVHAIAGGRAKRGNA